MFIIIILFFRLFDIDYTNEIKLIDKKKAGNISITRNSDIIQSDLINNNNINIKSKRKLQEKESIRIFVDTSQLEYQNLEAHFNITIIKDSIKKAKEAIEELIKVIRRDDRIFLNEGDKEKLRENGFYQNQMNSTLIDKGVENCDLLICVRFSDQISDPNMISEKEIFAKPGIIRQENTKRPLIGYIIYNRSYQTKINKINNIFQKEIISTIFLHEFIHILGFMAQIFKQFDNYSNIFINKTVKRIPSKEFTKTIVKSKKILDIASKYFNCTEIEGIELENQDNIEGLEKSHWEGRILLGDIMISDLYFQEQVISEFTLALLEESGWYEANYYTGGLMKFGKNKGCDFFTKDCLEVKLNEDQDGYDYTIPFPNEFCTSQYQTQSDGTCSTGRISRGYCQNRNSVTDLYKRTSIEVLGKKNAEYCPVSIDSVAETSNFYNGNCKIGNNKYGYDLSFKNGAQYEYSVFSDTYGEKHGDNSFCALSSVLHKNETKEKLDIYGGQIRPTCYPMFCSEKSLTIQINELFVVCPRNGSAIEVGREYMGYILCPDYNSICSGIEVCNNVFDCIQKKSRFKENYTYDYSTKDVINNVNKISNNETRHKSKLVISYELSDDGKCPKDCIQCLENRRCLICRNYTENKLPFYIGINETDNLEIICLENPPSEGYYNKSNYYYKCVDNCLLCENQYECLKCGLTHYIGDNKKCEERIVGCRDYNQDPAKIVDEPRNGENGKGYSECLNCKNDENYYCLDGNYSTCVYLSDYDNETYYEMEDRNYSCVQRCEKRFTNCEKCNRASCYECIKNATYIINNQGNCIEKIDYCKNQNKDVEYKQCLECDNQYYCIQNDTLNCRKVENISLYYSYKYITIDDKEINCFERCNNTFKNCLKCNKNSCTLCIDGYELNNNKYCVKKIDNCVNQNMNINYEQCLECRSNYYCIGNDSAHCQSIDNIQYYYYFTETPIYCIKRCNETFDYCVNCDKNECKKCEEGFFIYNGACIKNITGCINHFYDGSKKECLECNENAHWYCIDKNKEVCHNTTLEKLLPYHYTFPDIDYSCYGKCNNFIENCVKCNNNTYCIECKDHYIVSDDGNECIFTPFDIPANDNCSVIINKSELNIDKIDPWNFMDYYWKNIPYVKIVDHYIGNNYTITVFVHSECTEDLLNQGYFKIDSKELQNIMIKESKTKGLKIIFAIYINYNHKSHLRFYNLTSNDLFPEKLCPSCFKTDYTITNKINEAINNTLGPLILNLLNSEKIDIIKRDSEVYNDICQNVTLLGIDIPLKKRLKYLYLHEYSDIIYCISENCTIDEYFKDELTVKCKCSFGNKFEDIFRDDTKFEYKFNPYEGESKESNEFVESLGIIKCSINGFNLNYFTNNIGAILCLIAIAAQIILFIYYCLCSKAIINVNKSLVLYNPPKKIMLKFISDWNKIASNNNQLEEEEIYVQPRDEAEDQLLEEERSYSNNENENIFDASGLSIDTNVGGAFRNINTGNKRREKMDQKKVLILLSNKGKNKSKNYQDDLKSDSDIIPLPQEEIKPQNLKFGKIYWHILSLKQHIINFFSSINCCNITESYIPLSIRFIRSIFMIILSFVFNILWLNQTYYEKKFEHFQEEYKLVYSENENIKIPLGEKISYAIGKVFGKAIISLILLLLVQLIIGVGFLPIRNKVIKAKRKKSQKAIQELVSKTKIKYVIFFIVIMILMVAFFFSLAGFGVCYGGGIVDYLTASIISLIFLEIFPFLWSILIALFRYFGFKNKNMYLLKISQFFMF